MAPKGIGALRRLGFGPGSQQRLVDAQILRRTGEPDIGSLGQQNGLLFEFLGVLTPLDLGGPRWCGSGHGGSS
jgi:hypothetical protein